MDRNGFIDTWKHELAGVWLENFNRVTTPQERGLAAGVILERAVSMLGRMYDQYLHQTPKYIDARQRTLDEIHAAVKGKVPVEVVAVLKQILGDAS